MEQAVAPLSESMVCECGAVLADTATGSDGVLVCESCGRAVKPTVAAAPEMPPVAINPFDYSVSADPKSRIQAAAAFVSQGKLVEALALYKWVHEEDLDHRDALYGMGFCYYKMGYLDRSQWILERAVALEHPAAGKLLKKVLMKLEAAAGAV